MLPLDDDPLPSVITKTGVCSLKIKLDIYNEHDMNYFELMKFQKYV